MQKTNSTILIVDDELSIRESFTLILEDYYKVITAASGEAALKKIIDEKVDLVFLDIRMPGMDGMETLRRIREIDRDITVVMVTAVNEVQKAGEAIKLGAYNYVVKPFDVDLILSTTKDILGKKSILSETNDIVNQPLLEFQSAITGQSKESEEIIKKIEHIAAKDQNIILFGEHGTNKVEIAGLIHYKSTRSNGPFKIFDIPRSTEEKVISDRLFGFGKGSFSYEFEKQTGFIEASSGGTLLLNNIENLPKSAQNQLAEAIEKKHLLREGSSIPIPVNTRIMASSSENINRLVSKGIFSQALFGQLNQCVLEIPPLRAHRIDIPDIINFFLEKFNHKYNKQSEINSSVIEILTNYDYPGNNKELENVIEMLVIYCESKTIDISDIPIDILIKSNVFFSMESIMDKFDKKFIYDVFKRLNFDRSKAVKILGLGQNVLATKIESMGLDTPDF